MRSRRALRYARAERAWKADSSSALFGQPCWRAKDATIAESWPPPSRTMMRQGFPDPRIDQFINRTASISRSPAVGGVAR
jgi:hypothetical protein